MKYNINEYVSPECEIITLISSSYVLSTSPTGQGSIDDIVVDEEQ